MPCEYEAALGSCGQLLHAHLGMDRFCRHRVPREDPGRHGLAREGSRVSVQLQGEEWRCHRPHPGKVAKRYQVEQARDLLDRAAVHP